MNERELAFYAHYLAALQVTQEYNRVTDNDQKTSLKGDRNRRGIRTRGPLMARFMTDFLNDKADSRIKSANVVAVQLEVYEAGKNGTSFMMGRQEDQTVHFMSFVESESGDFYLMDLSNAYTASKNCMHWVKSIAQNSKITIVGLSPIEMSSDVALSFAEGNLVEAHRVSFVTWQESEEKKGLFKVDLSLQMKIRLVKDIELVKKNYLYDSKKLEILMGISKIPHPAV